VHAVVGQSLNALGCAAGLATVILGDSMNHKLRASNGLVCCDPPNGADARLLRFGAYALGADALWRPGCDRLK
jgi:hypothetical protein